MYGIDKMHFPGLCKGLHVALYRGMRRLSYPSREQSLPSQLKSCSRFLLRTSDRELRGRDAFGCLRAIRAMSGSEGIVDENGLTSIEQLMKSSRLTHVSHKLWEQVLQPGDVACDATCGNGHDSVFLANQIGPKGKLILIDIQESAVNATQEAIEKALPNEECRPDISYVVGCHANLQSYLGSNCAKLICFNLGYLPGGDKSITTTIATSVSAVEASLEALQFGGLISLLCYTGHPGGAISSALGIE
eukprot:jgi/Picsp_1/5301/NSC_02662-R1_rrna methylase